MFEGELILDDGTVWKGESFGAPLPTSGELVFNTGMTGYVQSLTDPSYKGQILVLSYPLIGNYGVPEAFNDFESDKIQVAGLIVSDYAAHYSHAKATQSLAEWLKFENIPALTGIDTRSLVLKSRKEGKKLGKIVHSGQEIDFLDPALVNVVEEVSTKKCIQYGDGNIKILILDCGVKNSMIKAFITRGCRVELLPWNTDFTLEDYDGLVISNGPGHPENCSLIIERLEKLIKTSEKPILGICLGHQLLGMAAGLSICRLPYGHRGQNQPVLLEGTNKSFLTAQNHGYALDAKTMPEDWMPWFSNLNDGSCEGIKHESKPFFGVQFHPEASPGPNDSQFVFDLFLDAVKRT
jgi:carbamoyl-phosphate synthase small subunit